MATIAFLGTGLMGSAFVELLCASGNDVVVWNRSPEKTQALVAHGARVAATPEEAVGSVERVHCMLKSDEVVDELLERVLPQLVPGTPLIDHSTVAPARVLDRAMRLQAQSIPFIHAPVFSPPASVRAKKAIMLACGQQAAYDRCADALATMAADVWWLGERADRAAAFKLFGNLFMMFVLNGLGDLYALAQSLDISAEDAHSLFAHYRPDATIDVRGKRMALGDFDPQFTLKMARKDIGLMLEAAQSGNVALSTLPHIASVFDRLIESGFGDLDVGAIAKAPQIL